MSPVSARWQINALDSAFLAAKMVNCESLQLLVDLPHSAHFEGVQWSLDNGQVVVSPNEFNIASRGHPLNSRTS